jgi:flagellar biosynthesis activator protein FlaF
MTRAMQLQAYRKAPQSADMSEREIDAYALTQSALKLRDCQQTWDIISPKDRIDRLFEALRINSFLWSIFHAEISRDGNPMPKQLRENLLTLSLFVDKRTKEVMCFPEPEKLTTLININLNIAAGLKVNASNS